MWNVSRRTVLRAGVAAAAGLALPGGVTGAPPTVAEVPAGDAPAARPEGVTVLYPGDRVPLSFIIDDSTCLANMGHFCMPQFRAAWPQNPVYQKDWRRFPREIPDSFLREFGEFCAEQGVRGKFSLVPYPACVGWLDRELPGWSRKELRESLALVRELFVPRWDITPEMITHTRVIDLKTGRPMEDGGPAAMENSYPPDRRSADELAAYVAYALRVLRNAEIPCTGVTTPGGFGNRCKSELSLAIGQALRDVFGVEIPHYFKYISDKPDDPVGPRLEHVAGVAAGRPSLVVDVPAGIGDHFGDWDGDAIPQPDKYATEDGTGGRMVELIRRGEPAVMFGHWAGFYCNGTMKGFNAAKRVILTLNRTFKDRTVWMSTGEMARYAAARALTGIERAAAGGGLTLEAPFACPMFTVRVAVAVPAAARAPVVVFEGREGTPLTEVRERRALRAGTWWRGEGEVVVCFDLGKGRGEVRV